MKNIIKIQSISDIITNSSSEVFLQVTEENINTCKKTFDNFVKIVDPSKSFDDLFELNLKVDEDYIEEYLSYFDEDEEKEEITNDMANMSLFEKAMYINERCTENGESPLFSKIQVIAKDDKNTSVAKGLENLINLITFDVTSFYS